MSKNNSQKGFTLIELLVVLAIVAILSVVVVLTLNPAELLKQARDSNRISDLSTLKTAISLYMADVLVPNLASSSTGYAGCYLSALPANATTTSKCGVFSGAGITTNVSTTAANYRKIDSTGWIPVSFTQISAGTPFSNLPVDPINNGFYYYAYAASASGVFELDTILESAKYSPKMLNSQDGGDNNSAYEFGTSLTL